MPNATRTKIVIGLADPLSDPQLAAQYAQAGATLFSLELVPRITRAQRQKKIDAAASMVQKQKSIDAVAARGAQNSKPAPAPGELRGIARVQAAFRKDLEEQGLL